jgi:uncharacterized protein with FMN-binding domain
MNRSTLRFAVPALALSSAALVSVEGAFAAAKPLTFKGPKEQVNHGPVQVSIVVKSKKIIAVKVAIAPDDPRGQSIQSQAIPILKQETLKAQSAKINTVSGATDTSAGYVTSLQAAIKKAKQAKALK